MSVRVNANSTAVGTVSYYYIDPRIDLTGKYSLNSQTGEIFTATETISGITVEYDYSDIRAKYNIARLVPEDDWEVDTKTKKVRFKDREILRNQRAPQRFGEDTVGAQKFYQASYEFVKKTRDDPSALEPFYSPILRDYALKIITAKKLV